MIDHLVYVVADLPAAVRHLEKQLGARFTTGGRHPDRGTVNALLRLDAGAYLELLAVDPEAPEGMSCWMGAQLLPEDVGHGGVLTRWAWNAGNDLESLRACLPQPAEVSEGMRRTARGRLLRWRMTEPGSRPLVSATPFLLDWLDTPHPGDTLPASSCRLAKLIVRTPDAFPRFHADDRVEFYPAPHVSLEAHIVSPRGEVVLR